MGRLRRLKEVRSAVGQFWGQYSTYISIVSLCVARTHVLEYEDGDAGTLAYICAVLLTAFTTAESVRMLGLRCFSGVAVL